MNYITITENQLNEYGFDFIPSGDCSIVINIKDSNNDGTIDLNKQSSDKTRIKFNHHGSPDKTETSLGTASHILLNFGTSIKNVLFEEENSAQLGTILAPDASVVIKATHDGNVISRTFENRNNKQIHQSGFKFYADAPATYQVTFSKRDTENPDTELSGASMKLTAGSGVNVDWANARVSGPAISGSGQAATWTTGDKPLVLKLPNGTYNLEETVELVNGEKTYELITKSTIKMEDGVVTEITSAAEDDDTVTVVKDGSKYIVKAFDKPKSTTPTPGPKYDYKFSKKKFAEKNNPNATELTGATMQLTCT
jgi:hypothetical protein